MNVYGLMVLSLGMMKGYNISRSRRRLHHKHNMWPFCLQLFLHASPTPMFSQITPQINLPLFSTHIHIWMQLIDYELVNNLKLGQMSLCWQKSNYVGGALSLDRLMDFFPLDESFHSINLEKMTKQLMSQTHSLCE